MSPDTKKKIDALETFWAAVREASTFERNELPPDSFSVGQFAARMRVARSTARRLIEEGIERGVYVAHPKCVTKRGSFVTVYTLAKRK